MWFVSVLSGIERTGPPSGGRQAAGVLRLAEDGGLLLADREPRRMLHTVVRGHWISMQKMLHFHRIFLHSYRIFLHFTEFFSTRVR